MFCFALKNYCLYLQPNFGPIAQLVRAPDS